MVHCPICRELLDACRCADSGQDEDVSVVRGPQLALAFDPSVQSEPKARLETDARRTASSTDNLQMAQWQQVNHSTWRVEHLANAICELLDWQDRMSSCKAERRGRAMRTREANRLKRERTEGHDSGVVAVSQGERLRRFLADGGKSVHESVASQVHDASRVD